MRERAGQILKAATLVLAALLLYQLVQVGLRVNPLSKVAIPALPRLDSDTNAAAGAPASGPARGSTNSAGTNFLGAKSKKEKGTNLVSADLAKAGATNKGGPLTPALSPSAGASENGSQPTSESNALTVTNVSSNSPVETNALAEVPAKEKPKSETASTNSGAPEAASLKATSSLTETLTNGLPAIATNAIVVTKAGTNTAELYGSNGLYRTFAGTNSAKILKSKSTNSTSPSAIAMNGMNFNPSSMRGGGKATELPPEIKARVNRIYESELFGMVMRPVPMGLLGIAGSSAILRSPSGQTGLVKEGDSLGELKLLRIGINRVLVELDGKKSELMIFDGYGGESLMPKEKETSK